MAAPPGRPKPAAAAVPIAAQPEVPGPDGARGVRVVGGDKPPGPARGAPCPAPVEDPDGHPHEGGAGERLALLPPVPRLPLRRGPEAGGPAAGPGQRRPYAPRPEATGAGRRSRGGGGAAGRADGAGGGGRRAPAGSGRGRGSPGTGKRHDGRGLPGRVGGEAPAVRPGAGRAVRDGQPGPGAPAGALAGRPALPLGSAHLPAGPGAPVGVPADQQHGGEPGERRGRDVRQRDRGRELPEAERDRASFASDVRFWHLARAHASRRG